MILIILQQMNIDGSNGTFQKSLISLIRHMALLVHFIRLSSTLPMVKIICIWRLHVLIKLVHLEVVQSLYNLENL
jgi:hypothetical protein